MAKVTKTTKISEEAAMAKNEKHNDGTMSGLKKTLIGTVGTLITAGGAFLLTYLQKPKENEVKQAQPQSININIPQQQQQTASGTKTIIIKEKNGETAKPVVPKTKKKEGDEFKEAEPKW
jgi:hypothetical protein